MTVERQHGIERIDRRELARRSEERFLVDDETARTAIQVAASHLDIAKHDQPYQWSTTTYCDTYDWRSYRASEAGSALQLRFREYHRSRPGAVFSAESTWIELKSADDRTSSKERFAVSTSAVPALLRGASILPAEARGLVAEARDLIAGGAHPVVVTQYNRLAYAAPRDALRITADHNLMYFAVPWGANDDAAVPRMLGPLLAREAHVIVEVKCVDAQPGWASDLVGWLRRRSLAERPSKFVIAMRHLFGEGSAPAA